MLEASHAAKQSRCDVVTSQGLRRRVACVGSLESGAASLSIPLNCTSAPWPWTIELSSETVAGLLWAMHACSRPLMRHAITMRCRHNARSRRVACDGSLESGAAVLSLQ